MRPLVLGGTGTVGSLVVRGLLDKGEAIVDCRKEVQESNEDNNTKIVGPPV